MAVAADHSSWVRELESYEAARAEDVSGAEDRDEHDQRYETSRPGSARSVQSRTARKAPAASARRRPPTSMAEDLKQEMKLLNWHKLANEAALKAAIIKTNKLKQEDSHLASALAQETTEEKQQRIQQIIEEEQLKPLQVNTEFYREFANKGQQEEAKIENEVQRHIQHLRKLKDMFAQREELHRRRQRFKQGLQELNATIPPISVPKTTSGRNSNQDEELRQQQQQQQNSQQLKGKKRLFQQQRGITEQAAQTAEMIGSLDKLMELEKRIRNLEEAGLGSDAMDDTMAGSQFGDLESNQDSHGTATRGGSKNVKFSKRKVSTGLLQPAKTVYAVSVGSSSGSNASKMRARDAGRNRTLQAPRDRRASQVKPNVSSRSTASKTNRKKGAPTFLTSIPEKSSKAIREQNLRRMTERERRVFLKNEKARAAKAAAQKQDVVIDKWLQKKQQAEQSRRATTRQMRSNNARAAPTRSSNRTDPRSTRAARSGSMSNSTRAGATRKTPVMPAVRAPRVGAASGKRAGNSHMQKFIDMKSDFQKRQEIIKRKSSLATTPAHANIGKTTRRATSTLPPPSATVNKQHTRTVPTASSRVPTKLPAIPKATINASSSQHHPRFSLTGKPGVTNSFGGLYVGATAVQASASPSRAHRATRVASNGGQSSAWSSQANTLPRLTGVSKGPVPSPPPRKASQNAAVPQFSRLHKR